MIDSFRGEHRWLSNFYPAEVQYEGVMYPSLEYAFQAAKTLNLAQRRLIRGAPTSGKAKALGRTVRLRPDWEEVKLEIMAELVEDKFTRHYPLTQRLLGTGDQEIVEGNVWGDRFWGVCDGKGENHLGRILMAVRDELRLVEGDHE